MNQKIYNLQRFLTEEGIPCTVRDVVGTARLFTGNLMIIHSGPKNCYLVRPFGKPFQSMEKPEDILKLIKETNGHNSVS